MQNLDHTVKTGNTLYWILDYKPRINKKYRHSSIFDFYKNSKKFGKTNL